MSQSRKDSFFSGKAHAPIILVGMMGAGKTTIGRQIAKTLDFEFIDLDHLIEERCGVRIPTIFELEGEQGFRLRESNVLAEALQQSNVVIATGGGAVISLLNREQMREGGLVVYLRAKAEDLFYRTRKDKNRPLLQTEDPLGKIRDLLLVRESMYEEVAHHVVDTGRGSVNVIVQKVLKLINN